MKSYIEYIRYILKHKYFVLRECWKYGLYWEGITHDISKLGRHEFNQYRRYFTAPRLSGNKPSQNESEDLNYAWLHHIHSNRHHWQYWVLREDDGNTIALAMPAKYILEMFCDWIGAGLAITGKDNLPEWYNANKRNMVLSDSTRVYVETLIMGRYGMNSI